MLNSVSFRTYSSSRRILSSTLSRNPLYCIVSSSPSSSSFSSSVPSSSRTYASSSILASSSTPASTPVSASLVKQLREMTGAPMMDCKNALVAEHGSIEKAVDWLRKKGMASAGKKAGRSAAQGLITIAINDACNTAAILEMNSETDFVARNNDFQTFTQRAAQGALLSLPSVSSSILSSTALTNTEAETVGSTTLSATVLTGGDILTNKDCTVKDGVIGLSAKVGENIILRRGIKYTNSNGILSTYIHNSINSHAGAIGVIVSLIPSASTSSSPPLTKSHPSFPALQDLGKKVAMHIAAAKPSYLNKETIPSLEMEKEKNLAKEQMVTQIKNKPDHIVNKILEGKLNKWYSEICLQEQTYALSEDTIKISKFVETTSKAAGYPVIVNGYVCFRVGETAPPATTAN